MAKSRNEKLLEKPIIFIGNPRSGTSVISEIIMRHRHLAFPSQYQNKFIFNSYVNLLRRLFDNGLWRIHGQKKQLNKVNFANKYTFRAVEAYTMWDGITEQEIDFAKGFLYNKSASPDSVRSLREYFGKMVRYQGKTRLSFKITGPSRMDFLSSIFPDALFVRIMRSPVPTVSSLLKISFWEDQDHSGLWWKGPYTNQEMEWVEEHKQDPVALTAFQIKKISDITDEEIKRVKPSLIEVQYADFVKDPENTIRQILEFVQLDEDKACFDYLKKNKIYNQNKKDEDYFTAKDLSTIREIHSA